MRLSGALVSLQRRKRIVNEVFDLMKRHGNSEYIGEPVKLLEHMLQAGELARQRGYPHFVKVGALFHDLGHLANSFPRGGSSIYKGERFPFMVGPEKVVLGVQHHDKLGAQYLQELGFDSRVSELAGGHVKTKRYLTTIRPEYYQKLSPASQETFKFQGGLMSPMEVEAYKNDPLFEWHLKLRELDELAKERESNNPPESLHQRLENFRLVCEEMVR